jgi:heat shock protein HslJ
MKSGFFRSNLLKALLVAAFAFVATGAAASAAQGTLPQAMTGADWVLAPVSSQSPISGDGNITIHFSANGDFGGDSTCNSYGGSATVGANGAISLGPIISTKRACLDNNLMQREGVYLTALDSVSAYKLDGATLQLTYKDGTLTFTRAGSNLPGVPNTGGGSLPILPLALGLLVVLGGVLLRVRSLRLAR